MLEPARSISRSSKAGSHGRGNAVSGLMFADYFVGIQETPGEWQKPKGQALEYTRKIGSVRQHKKVCSSCM